MIDLPVTLATASVLGIFYILLSAAVSRERGLSKIGLGGGEASAALGAENKAPRLLVAMRRHGQFAEYVPISLLLIMLLELHQVSNLRLWLLAGALVLSRLMVVLGMGRAAPNVLRAGGSLLQYVMIVAASVYGLVLVAGSYTG